MSKVFIEYDELNGILQNVRNKAKTEYLNDSSIKKLIDDIFWEIDVFLIRYEADYKFKRLMYGDNESDNK
jgi:hypothetical protein